MKRNEHIETELAEISSTLAAFSNTLPYLLPEDYFESFPAKMLDLIHYTEQNQSSSEEILTLSPLLAGLKNKETLQLPDNYFAQLAKETVESVQQQQTNKPARVIPINVGFKTQWIRYAIAAAVIGFIGIAALLVWNNRIRDNSQSFASINSLQNEKIEMPQLSEEALAEYLKALPGNENVQSIDSEDAEFYDLALLRVDDAKLVSILENVPEEELASYAGEL